MSRSEYRQLEAMIQELRAIRTELLGKEVDEKRQQELATKDSFGKKKHLLTVKIQEIREDVERLVQMKRNLPKGRDRNQDTIKLEHENRKRLGEANEEFAQLKKLFEQDMQRFEAGKSDLTQADLEDRRQALMVLANDLDDLIRRNGVVKPRGTEELDLEGSSATSRREHRRDKRRQGRERRCKERRGTNAEEPEGEAIQMTQQDQQWYDQVEQNYREQNEMLGELEKNLDELKHISIGINKELTKQNQMLQLIEQKVDRNIDKLKTANQRLRDILDSQGGMSTWCPRIFFLIILVALVVYILGMI